MTELSCSYNPVLGSIVMSLKWPIFLDYCYWILVQRNPAFSESYGLVLESFFAAKWLETAVDKNSGFGSCTNFYSQKSIFHIVLPPKVKVVHRARSGLLYLILENLYILFDRTNAKITICGLHNWTVHLRWEGICMSLFYSSKVILNLGFWT